jgi:hypothetical protein
MTTQGYYEDTWESSDGLSYTEGKVLAPSGPWPAMVSVDAIDLSSLAEHDARSLAAWLTTLADVANRRNRSASVLPTEPKYGSSSFWHPLCSGSARPMNPERGDDWATGKGGRPGVGPSDSPPASSDVKPPWQPWTDHAAMDAELESLRSSAARIAELEAALWQIVNNAEAWHGDDAAKGRALAAIALTGRTALNATR